MSSLKQYLAEIEQGEIPDFAPYGTSPWGQDHAFELGLEPYEARTFCITRGLWTVIDRNWTGALAEWLGDRSVLEIMAGGGWIAKALAERGVLVVATDDFSWGFRHKELREVHPVQNMAAVDAVRQFPADVLLVSWPPYDSLDIIEACRTWGPDRPIVYIGEGQGGCNAPDEFWRGWFQIDDDDAPFVPLMSWPGLHDGVRIGHWREPEGEPDGDPANSEGQ